ncbi:MAG: zinc-ribbon domain-containing protein [Lachnospiraceae bacterium]|nr:zinc-ribbon domain-containing protein [Lachnospiraceae bacterium]
MFYLKTTRCPHCGKMNQTIGKYCPYCGKEIN